MKKIIVIILSIIGVLVISFLIFFQFFSVYQIPSIQGVSEGMYPALTPGDFLLVQKSPVSFEKGDIILILPNNYFSLGVWLSRIISYDGDKFQVKEDSENTANVTIQKSEIAGTVILRYRRCEFGSCRFVFDKNL